MSWTTSVYAHKRGSDDGIRKVALGSDRADWCNSYRHATTEACRV